jgi:hypothetical protein
VKWMLVGALVALVLAGCGGSDDKSAAKRPAPVAKKAESPTLIVFRRVRYEGATMNVMTLYADGFVTIDVPNGGAGGAKFVARATPRAVRGVRRAMARTPWRHLSKRRVLFDRSGAYFMLHHRGEDYIAMAAGMSPDLKPLVTRLNAILVGDARGERRVVHRWGSI